MFRDVNEAPMAYDEHVVTFRTAVRVKITKDLGLKRRFSKAHQLYCRPSHIQRNIPQDPDTLTERIPINGSTSKYRSSSAKQLSDVIDAA